MQYAQEGKILSDSDGRTKLLITCFRCEKIDHFADFSPIIETGEEHVEVAEHHHMEALTLFDEDNDNSDDDSIVITYQGL